MISLLASLESDELAGNTSRCLDDSGLACVGLTRFVASTQKLLAIGAGVTSFGMCYAHTPLKVFVTDLV